jgi:hypothetical protein
MAENAAATPQPALPASEGASSVATPHPGRPLSEEAVLLESGRAPTRSGDATACSSGDGESCCSHPSPPNGEEVGDSTRTEGMCSAGEMVILPSSFLLILSDLLLCLLSEVA